MIKNRHGVYYVVIKYRDMTGKQREKWYKSGTNYRDAQKLEHKMMAARDDGAPIIAKTDMPTAKEFFDEWLETAIKPPAKSGGTYDNYMTCTNKDCQYIGKTPLDKITPLQLTKMYRSLLHTSHLSITYVRMIHRVLRTAFNTAIRWNILAHNPCLSADVPAPAPSPAKALDKDQAVAFLHQSAQLSPLAHIIVALGILCGLRDAEQCGLRWRDYDPETGRLHIQHNLNVRILKNVDMSQYEYCRPCGKKFMFLDKVKTKASNNTIVLPMYVQKLFKQQHFMYNIAKMKFGPSFHDDGFILCNDIGIPKNPQFIYDTVQRVWRAYNNAYPETPLPKIRAHDLRHTAATLLLEENIDIKYVSRQLRHSSTVITQNLYQHVTDKAASRTADAMDRLLDEARLHG